uniref:F-box only protein 30 n=1 Tax=Syphacia muris TaxID=451379 RepID=A0A0N5ANA9_9BILA
MDCSVDIDDHVHCQFCYKIECSYSKCPVKPCPECRTPLHQCKLEDHFLICLKVQAPCPNFYYGCKRLIQRDKTAAHLKDCNASVVFCAFQWHRRVLNQYAKRKMKQYARKLDNCLCSDTNDVSDSLEIDVCSALADQKVVSESYRSSRLFRKRQTDFLNPCHPLLPMRLQDLQQQIKFDDVDSSDEENRKKEEALRKKRSPFESCYLCKIDPTSQHLHKLGNLVENENHAAISNVKDVKPQVSVIPTFYKDRNLFLSIVRERLNPYVAKAENVILGHKGISVYSFLCNNYFRRSEFSDHCDLVHGNCDEFIERCPNFHDGCPFFYYLKKPSWGILRYCEYSDCLIYCPPDVYRDASDNPSRCIPFENLPLLVLNKILGYLDPCSLRCLSATCKYLRHICYNSYGKTTMVLLKWKKLDTGNWTEACYVCFLLFFRTFCV